MNVKEILEEVKDAKNPYEAAMAIDPMFWVKFVRRHDANYFDVHFHDKEVITDNDITETIRQVAEFYGLPQPIVKEKAEVLAEVMTSENAEETELYYNAELMYKAGINNLETLQLAFAHEIAHQLLFETRFMLFENELWIQELAADLLVAGFSISKGDIATGKYKFVLKELPASMTHPDGKLRAEIVEYGRRYYEKLHQQGRYQGIKDMLTGLPAFVYSHYRELQELWEAVNLEDAIKEPQKPVERKPIDYESLPDTNLLKQYWMKHKNDKKKEDDESNG